MLYLKDGIIFQKNNEEKIYPNAKEILNLIKAGAEILNDNSELVKIRFSSIPLVSKVEFLRDNVSVYVSSYVIKRENNYFIKDIDNYLVDYIIIDSVCYYLTGELPLVKELMESNGLEWKKSLTLFEYMQISRDIIKSELTVSTDVREFVNNEVSSSDDLNLKANLFSYQKIGVNWLKFMVNNKCGCILADEMGLGKTIQVIATLGANKGLNKHFLIVAPISLLENWSREIEKFYPSLSTYVNYGNNQIYLYQELLKYDVVITSYSNVNRYQSIYNMICWDIMVLDEAQNIKNPYAKRTLAIKEINRSCSIAVTGTPFENHMTDLWSLVDFVLPGYLGKLNNFEKNIMDNEASAITIEKYLTPIMIRRKVKDVAKDLPERIDIPQCIVMTANEASFYNEGVTSIQRLENLKSTKIEVIQKLRLFCTHPMVYNSELKFPDPCIISNKYCRLCEILESIIIKKEKCLIFTSFNKMQSIMMEDLKSRFNIYINFINGSVEAIDRQKIVDEFSNVQGSAILILNPKAAGAGLNITAANHVIHYNLDWNPAVEDQASARSYRRGQEKTVFIYRLFYKNTIEEIINDRIESKRDISELAVVGNSGEISDEELYKLLSSPIDKEVID